jgi:hypothetical protein
MAWVFRDLAVDYARKHCTTTLWEEFTAEETAQAPNAYRTASVTVPLDDKAQEADPHEHLKELAKQALLDIRVRLNSKSAS